MLNQKVVNEEPLFIMGSLSIDPELVFRNEIEPVMLTKIGEFFVKILPNIGSIYNPDSDWPTLANFFQIRSPMVSSLSKNTMDVSKNVLPETCFRSAVFVKIAKPILVREAHVALK